MSAHVESYPSEKDIASESDDLMQTFLNVIVHYSYKYYLPSNPQVHRLPIWHPLESVYGHASLNESIMIKVT